MSAGEGGKALRPMALLIIENVLDIYLLGAILLFTLTAQVVYRDQE